MCVCACVCCTFVGLDMVLSAVMSLLNLLKYRCVLKHVAERNREGRIKVTGRRERMCKQLLEDINKK